MMTFRQHNLLDPLPERPFDLVFLKNVLIYFDRDSKQRVIANVQKVISPGGMMVAGAAEGVADMVRDLVRIEPWLFQRATTQGSAGKA
jgi:chemotaxis protein methyltransferase CheR